MPLGKLLAQQHEAKARHNYSLYNQLRADEQYLDWAVTLLFYTALHLAQAYLVEAAATGFDIPKGHPERSREIARQLPEIYEKYRFLETRSTSARYYAERPKPTAQEVQQYHDQQFTDFVKTLAEKGVTLS